MFYYRRSDFTTDSKFTIRSDFSTGGSFGLLNRLNDKVRGFKVCFPCWVLPEDYCKKDPCNFNTEMFVSKAGQPMSNSWSTSSWPDFVQVLAWRKTVRNRPSKILYTELLKLANSWSTPRQLPTPWEVAGVFLAIVLWQHPTFLAHAQQISPQKARNTTIAKENRPSNP